MKPYIEKDCGRCGNREEDECIKYGMAADVAVERCAEEAFINYVLKQHEEE